MHELTKLIYEDMRPALGVTEPGAIAFAVATARRHVSGEIRKVLLRLNSGMFKNAFTCGIPGSSEMGNYHAAALGAVGADPDKGLECLDGITRDQANKAREVISEVSDGQKQEMRAFLDRVPVKVEAIDNGLIFDILVALYHGTQSAVVRITHYHTNIVYIKKNGSVLLDRTEETAACGGENPAESGLTDKSLLTVADIFDFAGTCDLEDVRPVLDTQIRYNTAISEEGLRGDYGANIGSTMLKFYGDDVRNRAIAKAAAGSDARMSGCELPVVINSGSGNQGITVSIPVIEYAKAMNASEDALYRALVLSNLIAIHEKTGIGRLSAYCGAVSAGCAAGCGIAYLHGADCKAISHTLVNALAIVSGIICDGAKPSCAAKIASSVEVGILGYHMYLNGQQFRSGDGIVTKGVEATIRNVGRLGRDGMRETDKEIVKIMMHG